MWRMRNKKMHIYVKVASFGETVVTILVSYLLSSDENARKSKHDAGQQVRALSYLEKLNRE